MRKRIRKLSQLRVLGLGFFKDGNIGVGLPPEREEVLIGNSCFGSVALQGVGATKLKMGKCTDGCIHNHTAMVEYFLKLGGGFSTLMRG
jgi:hypothetical protein